MMAPTHVTFAEFLYLLILTTTGVALSTVNVLAIAVSSLMPDIDTKISLIGRALPFVSGRIERRFGHRTLTHSAVMIGLIALVLLPLMRAQADLYVCLVAGYASHPFLDTMTVNGVKLFYPFSTVKCVFPLEVNNPHRYRVQTGGGIDKALAVFFLLGCMPAAVIAYLGYERFVRVTQKSIEAAVRDYNEYSADHIVLAEIEAHSALTREAFSGTFEIAGALNAHTLLFLGPDGCLHTLGRDFESDYVAGRVLCSRGEPASASVRTIDMSNRMLSGISSLVDTSARNYLLGDLTTPERVSLPQHGGLFSPVTGSGSTIRFNHAAIGDLRRFGLESVLILKGVLTVKSILCGTRKAAQGGDLTGGGFSQVSVTLGARETIEFLKKTGDTVRSQELIARKLAARFYGEETGINDEKIRMLLGEARSSSADIAGRIAIAERAAGIDSGAYRDNLALSADGYLPGELVESSGLKWQKDKRELSRLSSLARSLREKISHEVRKLRLSNAELEAKSEAAERQSAVRSDAEGILSEIRSLQKADRTLITFVIRHLR